ncbi:hypothetical protein E2C01_052754 [Portunus trituberculatus]|uniref:Uncharacterized protein n=1 Tax=Portunus trituberculatus TaxID=210409 RepID=A0A5B7GMQ4_PORTR|nr:hypothetical protein [Portunus trituberculatus]
MGGYLCQGYASFRSVTKVVLSHRGVFSKSCGGAVNKTVVLDGMGVGFLGGIVSLYDLN